MPAAIVTTKNRAGATNPPLDNTSLEALATQLETSPPAALAGVDYQWILLTYTASQVVCTVIFDNEGKAAAAKAAVGSFWQSKLGPLGDNVVVKPVYSPDARMVWTPGPDAPDYMIASRTGVLAGTGTK